MNEEMKTSKQESTAMTWLVGGGEMGKRIRSFDWSNTPLGAVESWPQSLRSTVSLCLASSFPVAIVWGSKHVQIYNDAYGALCGAKHPDSIGQNFRDCWASAWDVLGEPFNRALAGEPAYLENQRMFLDRNGYLEEAFFTFSFSPIRDETGEVGGLFHPVTETTSQMLSERRLEILRELATRTGGAKTIEAACLLTAETLANFTLDLPFVLLYRVDAEAQQAHLAGISGLPLGPIASCAQIDLTSSVESGWPLAKVAQSGQVEQVNLEQRFGFLSSPPYPESPQTALVMPIIPSGQASPVALLVAGVSVRRALDADYRQFYNLLADTVTQAVTHALVSEAERQRTEALSELDRDWRFAYVNDRFAELVGMPKAELLGKNAWQVFPDAVVQALAPLQQAVTEQVPLQFEFLNPLDNRWFENRVYPSATGVSVFTTEITDRKQAEAVLRDAQVQLESAMAAGAVYTWRWNITTNRLTVNAAFAHLFGVDPEAARQGLPLETFVQSIHPEDRPRISAAIARAIETGEEYGTDYRVYAATGEERWVVARGQVEYDDAGRPLAFPGALIDITDRKRTEELLQQREAELRLITNTLPVLISFVDSEQRYRFNNRTYEEWLGHPASAVYGKHLQEVVGETAYSIIRPYVEQVLSGQQVTFESQVPYEDGRTRFISATYLPRFGHQGTVEGFVALVSDISDRKQAEVEREQLLAREQAAREQAETANRIKDEFLAVLSHELRSPLNPILGWSRLLRSGELDATKTAYALETIERNAKLQTQLIEDLLDVSRILQGKMSLNMAAVNLATTIEAALETVRSAAEAKSIEIQIQLEPAINQVLGDAARLQQIVWNLLSNAVKFTPSGGRVEILLTDDGSHAHLQVKDTGKGIAPDFLPYVFDYFRQADAATTRKFGGLGLGLAIVRHLVELHGGTVQVESLGEAQGATFTVKLPLFEDDSRTMKNETAASAFRRPHALEEMRILIVDDEADTRELIAFALEQNGATVTVVESAIEALSALQQSLPDVLVSDIGMPEMDGYMLLKQLRAMSPQQGGQIPAIALTAYAGEMDEQQALKAGFQKHLAKPVELDELVKTVVELSRPAP